MVLGLHLPLSSLTLYILSIYRIKNVGLCGCFTGLALELELVKQCNVCTAVRGADKNTPRIP